MIALLPIRHDAVKCNARGALWQEVPDRRRRSWRGDRTASL